MTRITNEGFGGIQVWTANPGKQRFYFAHLSAVYPDLKIGDVLETGDLIGFVGNSGNATGARPHLHFGIYDDDYNTMNPYLFITREFTSKEQLGMIKKLLKWIESIRK